MDDLLLKEICAIYRLGNVTKPPKPISGGFLHVMWKIETEHGAFAIKELSREIMKRPGLYDNFVLSEKIAIQFAEKGIAAVTALSARESPVQKISEAFVIVYPWIEGHILSTSAASEAQCEAIGKAIGLIHSANLEIPELQQAVAQPSDTKLVLSHGDIDQKNVIWTKNDTHPHIIDWEGVSLIDPNIEIVGAALNWAGLVSGKINPNCIHALMKGYRESSGSLNKSPEAALSGCIESWKVWLAHNNTHATSPNVSPEKQNIAQQQIEITSRNIALIEENFIAWSQLFSEYQEEQSFQ